MVYRDQRHCPKKRLVVRFKRRDEVQKLIQEQIDLITQGLGFLKEPVDFYLEGNKEECELKTKADGVERKAEKTLYEGMYLTLFREDLLDLLELVDDVADEAEKIADFLSIENPEIPSRWNEKIREIMEKSTLAFMLFRESFMFLYEDTQKAFNHTLRDLVIMMGFISDSSGKAADKISMISIKRRI